MSNITIFHTNKEVYFGSDSAISTNINNTSYRLDTNAKKIFIVNNMLIFCSGNLNISYEIMKQFQDCNNQSIKQLQRIAIDNYIEDNSFLEIMVGIVENYNIIVYQISSYNNFKVIKNEVNENEIGLWVGGFKTQEAYQLSLSLFNQKMDLFNIYQNVFNEISCEEIGGILSVYKLDTNNNISLVYQNNIQEKFNLNKVLKHMVIGERIIGQILLGENLYIDASSEQTGESFFKVDETGVWISGTALHIDGGDFGGTDPDAIHFGEQYNSMILSAEGGIQITNTTTDASRLILNAADSLKRVIRIQKSTDLGETWKDVFYTDAEGNLNLTGTLTGSTIQGGIIEAGDIGFNSIIKMTDDGLWAGNKVMQEAPFSVDVLGNLKATGAQIEGIITCSQLWINEVDVASTIQIMEGKFTDAFYEAVDITKLFAQGSGQIIEYVELPWTAETPLNGNLDFMFTNWYTDHPCYILQPSVAAQVLYDPSGTYYIGVRVPNYISTGSGIFNLISVCDGFYKKATDPDPVP